MKYLRHAWPKPRGLTQSTENPTESQTERKTTRWWKQSKTATRSSGGTVKNDKTVPRIGEVVIDGEENGAIPLPLSLCYRRRAVNSWTWLSCLAEQWPRNFVESTALLWVVYDGQSNAAEEYASQIGMGSNPIRTTRIRVKFDIYVPFLNSEFRLSSVMRWQSNT